MFGKRKIAALVAEFLGTGALTLLILSVQRSQLQFPFFTAMAAGLTVALMMFALSRTSGGYFNPALTIGFWLASLWSKTARKISAITMVLYVGFQMLGGWAAYYLYTYFIKQHLVPVGGKFMWHIFVAEAIGTALFAFGMAAAVYQRLSVAATAAYGGLALMIGSVAVSSASIGMLNPAVALGIRAWVWGSYVAGPIVGAVVGINLYALLFAESEAGPVATPRSTAVATVAPVKSARTAKAAKKPVAKKKTTTRAKKK